MWCFVLKNLAPNLLLSMAKVTVMRVDDESNMIPRHYAAMKVSRSVADRILSFAPCAIWEKISLVPYFFIGPLQKTMLIQLLTNIYSEALIERSNHIKSPLHYDAGEKSRHHQVARLCISRSPSLGSFYRVGQNFQGAIAGMVLSDLDKIRSYRAVRVIRVTEVTIWLFNPNYILCRGSDELQIQDCTVKLLNRNWKMACRMGKIFKVKAICKVYFEEISNMLESKLQRTAISENTRCF